MGLWANILMHQALTWTKAHDVIEYATRIHESYTCSCASSQSIDSPDHLVNALHRTTFNENFKWAGTVYWILANTLQNIMHTHA